MCHLAKAASSATSHEYRQLASSENEYMREISSSVSNHLLIKNCLRRVSRGLLARSAVDSGRVEVLRLCMHWHTDRRGGSWTSRWSRHVFSMFDSDRTRDTRHKFLLHSVHLLGTNIGATKNSREARFRQSTFWFVP